jgi:hypothetical protein
MASIWLFLTEGIIGGSEKGVRPNRLCRAHPATCLENAHTADLPQFRALSMDYPPHKRTRLPEST